jgi:phosphotransferase system  glucose/maltose/N-acetylglucosamine-specific IIC component
MALEAGIGGGSLLSAWIYNNQPTHFIYAFLLPACCAAISMFLLYFWMGKKKAPEVDERLI